MPIIQLREQLLLLLRLTVLEQFHKSIGISTSIIPMAAGVRNNVDQENLPGSPQHAVDNDGGFEFALFSFTDIATGVNVAATLNSLAIGWNNNGDADVSVLAYTGSGTPTISGKNLSSNSTGLLGSGWSLVANLANMGTGDGNARAF